MRSLFGIKKRTTFPRLFTGATRRTAPALAASFAVVLLAAFVLGGCETTGSSPDRSGDETVTKTLIALDSEGDRITDAVFYDADSDRQLNNPAKKKKGTEMEIRAEAEYHHPEVQTVTFDSDGEVEFTLAANNPDKVTQSYTIRDEDGQLIDGANLYIADTLASEGADGSVTLPYGTESVEFCGRADYHQQACREAVPDADQTVELELPAEMVTVTITPEIVGYTDLLRQEDNIPHAASRNTEYRLTIGEEVWVDNLEAHDNSAEFIFNPHIREGLASTYEYPAGPDAIEISGRAVYIPKEGPAWTDDHYLNVAEGAASVPGDQDSEITLPLEHIPACADGVDNTFSGRMDANAYGCLDTWASTSIEPGTDGFVYEPADDYESLRGHTRTTGISPDRDYFVSGKAGEREDDFGDFHNPHWPQVEIAVYLEVQFTKLVSDEQTGEELALEFRSGPNRSSLNTVNTTKIIPDEGADGWTEVTLPISRDYFSEGRYFAVKFIHATKLRGEPTTNGNDDVFIFKKGRDDYFITRALYEPEEVPGENWWAKQLPETRRFKTASPEVYETHDTIETVEDLRRFRDRRVDLR
ncbi:MAG: hypothetical protein U5K69_28190 [Balneolaceae bacterium]|nr:hypothetical protein [Balneolaceae bacterium]